MEGRGRRVSISSACVGSDAPASTALRYLSELEERNLLERELDPLDNRKRYVKLTARGRRLLREYIAVLIDARQSLTRL
jgi:DNA-binding MarR family transcriptional regulator